MKKTFRFFALLIAALMVLTSLASVALAEPSEEPVVSEPITEESTPTDTSVSEPEASEPEASQPEESQPEASEPEASQPEAGEPETSEPEASQPEASEPEASEPEASEPEASEPEASEPEASEPEVSQPEVSEPEKQEYSITFTVVGTGSVSVYRTRGSVFIAKITEGTQTITSSESIKFSIEGEVLDVAWTEPQRAVSNGYYFITPSRDSTVTVKVNGNGNNNDTSEPETSQPESFDVRVQVGTGGSIKAGDRNISGGNGTNVTITAGEDMVFTITPDEGYEVEAFKIDGNAVELTDNNYTLNTTTAIQSISVSFKTIGSEIPSGVSVTDIDWTAAQITVDVSGGKMVLREVFDRIATLTADSSKYVAFVSENGTIYVPYGRTSVGTSATVNMSVSMLQSGAELTAISDIFGGDASKFKAYSFDVTGNNLPMGTVVTFNLGAELANSQMKLYTFDGTKLNEKSEAVSVSGDGVSGMYEYSNEAILVCASGISDKFTIEAILMNIGGNINPLGLNEVDAGSSCNYVITATEGYAVKQIFVDDVAIENVEGAKNYIHIFENVGANHTIKVEFVADAVDSGDDSESDGGNGTLIVVLVIVVVAVLGAAALFIVKWRQEKY